MKYKSFVITVLSIISAGIITVCSFIYYIDPLWIFGTSHEYNDVQIAPNERHQKMNAIRFQPFEYDTLLLGSSRSTYIDQNEFKNMDVYNFSVANISVREYNAFIEYAKERRGKEFETIIIGLDFFKTSIDQSSVPGSLDTYANQINEPFFRAKSLFSLKTLSYAIDNFKLSYNNSIVHLRTYDRDNVAQSVIQDYESVKQQTEEKIIRFKEVFYGDSYEYNPDYTLYLEELKTNNPNTKFIIFTTPISTPLFEALVESGRLPDYNRWIMDVVSVFGEVHNFMYPNSFTDDLTNYFDGHHFYPHAAKLIAKSLNGERLESHPDFGVVVTPDNAEEHLATINQSSKKFLAIESTE